MPPPGPAGCPSGGTDEVWRPPWDEDVSVLAGPQRRTASRRRTCRPANSGASVWPVSLEDRACCRRCGGRDVSEADWLPPCGAGVAAGRAVPTWAASSSRTLRKVVCLNGEVL